METPSPLSSRHITLKGKKSFKTVVPNILLIHNAYLKFENNNGTAEWSAELDNLETALESHWNMVSNPSSRASMTTLAQNIRTLYTIMTSIHPKNAFWKREAARVRYALGEHLALYKTKDVQLRISSGHTT
jgi:hypothetical protein